MIYSEIVNFDFTEGGLIHQNGVEFQQFNGAIRNSLTAMYDDVRPCAT